MQLIIEDFEIILYTAKITKSETISLNLDLDIPEYLEILDSEIKQAHLPTLKGIKIIDKALIKDDMIKIEQYKENIKKSIEQRESTMWQTIKDYTMFSSISVIVIIVTICSTIMICKLRFISKFMTRPEQNDIEMQNLSNKNDNQDLPPITRTTSEARLNPKEG